MQSDDTQHEREVLVILRSGTTADGLARLKNQYQVTSVVPPRIVVLSAGQSVERLNDLPDVEAVLARPSDETPSSLNESERLFVSAWRARQYAGGKTRVGEGLAWDAPGFLPPDPPKRD
jgi:hypothetical protein